MEWLSLLIPIILIPILKHYFDHKITWYEVVVPVLPPLLLIPIIGTISHKYQTADYERHGSWVTEVRYYEDWDEWIVKTCSEEVTVGRDKDGRTITRTRTYDCSYRQYHPEYYEADNSNGQTILINKETFEYFKKRFNNVRFIDMQRNEYSDDGDLYKSVWLGNEESFSPMATEHYYENKVQANNGVFEYEKISKEDQKLLYAYPKLTDYFNDKCILGNCSGSYEADLILQKYNAKLGKLKEIRYWILIFHNQPRQIGLKQEALWKGGNKNEFVVCINLDSNEKPTWCHTFCWSPDGHSGNDTMRINVRDVVEKQSKINLQEIINTIVKETHTNWLRKSFKEFDYLSVKMGWFSFFMVYFLTIISTFGTFMWAIMNDYN